MMEEGGQIDRARGNGILCTNGRNVLSLDGRKDDHMRSCGR